MKLLNRIIILLSTVYIIWRLFTIPTEHGIVSIIFACIFLIIEIIDFIELIVIYFNSITKDKSNIYKEQEYKAEDVDIIIPTINESMNVITRTLEGVKNIDFDKSKLHVYVSDDGNRKDVEKLTSKFGFTYITRYKNQMENKGAKAGNLNFALKNSSSEYILILDCDMKPKKDILNKLLPYMLNDEKLGFVQAPQSFVNPDIFQYRFKIYNYIPNDQNYFYNVLQNSNNSINAVVMCGTNVIIRRKALENKQVNGFDEDIIAEDFATGMLIQNAGYKTLYVNENVAEGYEEESLSGFIKQRERWQRGCIRTGKKYNILRMKGLNVKQKLSYIIGINYWMSYIKTILFLIAPILFDFFGIYLISCNWVTFALLWIPQYLLKRYIIDLNYYGMSSATWSKIYQVIFAPILSITALLEAIGMRKKNFNVSSKSVNNNSNKKYNIILFFSHFMFLILNMIAYFKSLNNIISNQYVLMTIFWSIANIIYLIIALIFDIQTENYQVQEYKHKYSYNKLAILKIFVNFLTVGDKRDA